MQSSPASRHFLPLRSKYSPQHPVFRRVLCKMLQMLKISLSYPSEDRDSEVLRNVGILLQHRTASQPRKPRFEFWLPWKLEISRGIRRFYMWRSCVLHPDIHRLQIVLLFSQSSFNYRFVSDFIRIVCVPIHEETIHRLFRSTDWCLTCYAISLDSRTSCNTKLTFGINSHCKKNLH
jgi:hypothetical protein